MKRPEEGGREGGGAHAPAEPGRMRVVAGVLCCCFFGGRGSGWRRLTWSAGRGDAPRVGKNAALRHGS